MNEQTYRLDAPQERTESFAESVYATARERYWEWWRDAPEAGLKA